MEEKPIEAMIEKIAKECGEANASKWTITKIVKGLSLEENKGLKKMRKRALEMLRQLDPKAAEIYASFQRMQVRTSSQLVEGFDRGNIIKSLLHETDVPRGVAEKIGHEVEEKIKDLEIESISTPLIREMVNVKLLEYGHENIRNQYTRLGLPVFEARKRAAQGPYGDRATMAEYNLLAVIPPRLGRMHLSGQIFIAEIQDFSTKAIAASISAEPAEKPRDTVFGILERANRLGRLLSWRPNIFALNAALAAGNGKKAAVDAAALFSTASRAVFPCTRAVPAFNVTTLFEPDFLSGRNVSREGMAAAANAMLKAGESGESRPFENAVAVDTKYKLKLLHNRSPKCVLNCRSTNWSLVNGVAFEGNGLCSFTALNLTMVALANQGNESAFFEELSKKARAIAELDQLKRKELSERSYIKGGGIEIEKFSSALALDSLFHASALAIASEKSGETLSFAEKALNELKKALPENFVLTELKNQAATRRFALQNKKEFRHVAKPAGEEKELGKSRVICRAYGFSARAESAKELAELIDGNARAIDVCVGGKAENRP
jgi:hypothetical protein